jgi:hypothetical protein
MKANYLDFLNKQLLYILVKETMKIDKIIRRKDMKEGACNIDEKVKNTFQVKHQFNKFNCLHKSLHLCVSKNILTPLEFRLVCPKAKDSGQ